MAPNEFLDSNTAQAVLTRAVQAPSVCNPHPWNWKLAEESLRLYADPKRQLSRTDPECRDLLISCGASLHHCTVALASMDWHASVRRLPDSADPALLAVVTVQRRPADELDLMLAEAITHRRTDLRAYGPGPVPWGDIAVMGARAARAGVMLRQIDDIPRLSAIVADAVSRRAGEPLDGLTDGGGSVAGGPAGGSPDSDNAAVLVLGTEKDDCLARLRAGEAASLVLLSATAMGLATCSITEPLKIAQFREEIRADVFGSAGYPQILIRMGWPPAGAEPFPAPPRTSGPAWPGLA